MALDGLGGLNSIIVDLGVCVVSIELLSGTGLGR